MSTGIADRKWKKYDFFQCFFHSDNLYVYTLSNHGQQQHERWRWFMAHWQRRQQHHSHFYSDHLSRTLAKSKNGHCTVTVDLYTVACCIPSNYSRAQTHLAIEPCIYIVYIVYLAIWRNENNSVLWCWVGDDWKIANRTRFVVPLYNIVLFLQWRRTLQMDNRTVNIM